MTEDRDFKRRARERAARTGESYADAKAALESRRRLRPDERVAFFAGVRLAGDALEVRVGDRWVVVADIDGTPVDAVVTAAKSAYGDLWLKRLGEDLPQVFAEARIPLTSPADITIVEPDGERRVLELEATEANRFAALTYNRQVGVSPVVQLPVSTPGAKEHEALRRLLVARHSYWGLSPEPDFGIAAAAAAAGLTGPAFDLEVAAVLAQLGDGHTRTRAGVLALMMAALTGPREFLPLSVIAVEEERWAAVKPGTVVPWDRDHPYLVAIDQRPIGDWVAPTRRYVTQGSPQLQRELTAQQLGLLSWHRHALGVPADSHVVLTLGDDRGSTRDHRLAAGDRLPRDRAYRAAELPEDVGYLAIGAMDSGATALKTFKDMAERRAVVLDLRGNRGGTRDLVRQLGAALLPADSPPVVYNAARLKLRPGDTQASLADRGLYPRSSNQFDSADRAAIDSITERFAPEWEPGEGFSDLQYGLLRPSDATFHYRGRVAILTDPRCFSACEILATALRCSPNTVHVGEPTGGGSGRAILYALPGGTQVQVSSMVSYQPSGALYEHRGVQPHHPIPIIASDLADGRDAALAAAREALER